MPATPSVSCGSRDTNRHQVCAGGQICQAESGGTSVVWADRYRPGDLTIAWYPLWQSKFQASLHALCERGCIRRRAEDRLASFVAAASGCAASIRYFAGFFPPYCRFHHAYHTAEETVLGKVAKGVEHDVFSLTRAPRRRTMATYGWDQSSPCRWLCVLPCPWPNGPVK